MLFCWTFKKGVKAIIIIDELINLLKCKRCENHYKPSPELAVELVVELMVTQKSTWFNDCTLPTEGKTVGSTGMLLAS